ncbi:MAG: sigma-54-dependent Fis family transcriptional regulator [Chromatiaceae bacterium]|nr:MAG: sigma-54-dependent Fis family transcriptional regulator [Chromatiaceae bacterium]
MTATEPSDGETILIVEDDAGFRRLLAEELAETGHAVTAVASAEAAQRVLSESTVALVLCDLRLPGANGFAVLAQTRTLTPPPSCIMLTGFGTIDQAVAALKAGADDFLTKPVDLDHLRLVIARVLENRRLNDELARLRALLADRGFHGMLGRSPAMLRLFEQIRRIARSESAALITGESGTGKELVARALHAEGPRADGPFIAVNCAGIPEALLESELMGHVAGAFSGARGARRGLFAEADQGTLFLDEIAEMPAGMQTKLLRVLQDGRVRPVGSNTEQATDVRVLAATHRDLGQCLADGRFRADLFYRLETFRIQVPPLRARGEDIAALLARQLRACSLALGVPERRLTPAAWRLLLRYPWPGNVRELHSLVERMVTLAAGEVIEVADLPERVRAGAADADQAPDQTKPQGPMPTAGAPAWETLAEHEQHYIQQVLAFTGGNKQQAARILGIGRKTLYRKLGDAV